MENKIKFVNLDDLYTATGEIWTKAKEAFGSGGGSSVEVVLTTGTSTEAVMSLNAVTQVLSNVATLDSNGKVPSSLLPSQDSGDTAYARKTDFSLDDLKAAVADGDLGKYGLKPGDLKTINGHTYIIAELNPMKGVSTPYCVKKNHVGLIVLPHTRQAWNASGNTYTGANDRGAGYKNSDLHYYLKNTVLPLVKTDLGESNLISQSKFLSNAINQDGYNKFGSESGCSSSWGEEYGCYISALSECLVFGAAICSSSKYDTGEAGKQLEVFLHYKHTEIFKNAAGTESESPYLRDVASKSRAVAAMSKGYSEALVTSMQQAVAALILFN